MPHQLWPQLHGAAGGWRAHLPVRAEDFSGQTLPFPLIMTFDSSPEPTEMESRRIGADGGQRASRQLDECQRLRLRLDQDSGR